MCLQHQFVEIKILGRACPSKEGKELAGQRSAAKGGKELGSEILGRSSGNFCRGSAWSEEIRPVLAGDGAEVQITTTCLARADHG